VAIEQHLQRKIVAMSYAVSGSYFESCNCDAICPCRMVSGVVGDRSTYGICFGVLCWQIESGHVADVDVGSLSTALACHYDDDEPGSPWTFVLYVDARGDEAQRGALADLFLGRVGGGHIAVLPWVRKASNLVDVRPRTIELREVGKGYELRVGETVELRAERPVATDAPVSCGIPGYEQLGTELYADRFLVDDAPFAWELTGNCAFASSFAYAS
jgi:hypothetical protein